MKNQNQELANQSHHKNLSASDVSYSLNVFFCLFVCLFVGWFVCFCLFLFLFFSNGVVAEARPKRYFHTNNNKIAATATRIER